MYTDSYKYLSEIMNKSFSSFASTYLESSKKSFEALTESAKYLAQVTFSGYSVENLQNSLSYLSDLCKDIASNIPEVKNDSFNFLANVVVQDEYVELTEDDCDSINTLLKLSDASNDEPKKVSKGKIAVSDFIKSALISIFIALIQMLQTSYYNKMNTIESQKAYMEAHQLQDEEIKLLNKQISLQEQEIQSITDYAESLEDKLNELIDCINAQESQPEIPDFDSDFSSSPETPVGAPTLQYKESTDMSFDQSQDESAE